MLVIIKLSKGVDGLDNFISLIIFTLPGILTYFLIQSFGVTPVQKHQGAELLSISALLCAPVAFLVIGVYNFLTYFECKIFNLNPLYIHSVVDLKKLSDNLGFLCYYMISSIIFSYLIARVITLKYKKLLGIINRVRRNNGYAEYSEDSTLWKSVFQKNDKQVVRISSFGNQDDYIVGSVSKTSRDFESEDRLLIKMDCDDFYNEYKNDFIIESVLVCPSSGLKIEIFQKEKFVELLEDYKVKIKASN